MKYFNKIIPILIVALMLNSCIEDNFTKPNIEIAQPNITTDATVAAIQNDLIQQYNTNRQLTLTYRVNETPSYVKGYVVSNDATGNFFEKLVVQDNPENPTAGIEILINNPALSDKYEVGRQIFIKLDGLTVTYDDGESSSRINPTNDVAGKFTLGHLNRDGRIDEIPASLEQSNIILSSKTETIVPTTINISEISQAHVNTFVRLESVQFNSDELGKSFSNEPADEFNGLRNIYDCNSRSSIPLETSTFASFSANKLPTGRGGANLILTKDFRAENFVVIANSPADLDFIQPYGCFNDATEISVADIKALYTGSTTTITQNSKIKIVITSDLSKGNISNRNAFGQDSSSGIALRFSEAYDLNLGDEIEVAIAGLTLSEFRGLLQLNLAQSDIISTTTGVLPTPEAITIAQALSGDHQGKLVSIENVQFKDVTKTYANANELTSDCNDALTVFVNNNASFSGEQISDKKGIIVGVISSFNTPQLYIRDTTDVNFTDTYDCNASEANIFFSELADPNNNSGARFIEIYNAGKNNVDLKGWKIRRYTNANSTPSSNVVDLTGSTINAAQAFVIAANATAFETAFGFAPDLAASTGGPADSNGDDNIELINPDGDVVDVFGVPGEDGTRTNHEFEDGRAYRKASVTQGNSTYTFAEWDIWNDSGNAGTTNAPQDAPGTFTPKVR